MTLVIIEIWLSSSEPTIIRRSTLVQQVQDLTSLLNQTRNYYYYYKKLGPWSELPMSLTWHIDVRMARSSKWQTSAVCLAYLHWIVGVVSCHLCHAQPVNVGINAATIIGGHSLKVTKILIDHPLTCIYLPSSWWRSLQTQRTPRSP